MRRNLLLVILTGLILPARVAPAWAQCPEDPLDSGICDTLYVEVYPPDTLFSGPGHFVRVPIYVTHDVPDPFVDSLAAFGIPLCYTHSNPSKYCSLSYHWNNIFLYPYPESLLERSVFRHFIEDGDTLIHNWMMDQSQKLSEVHWDWRVLDLDGSSHFWFATRCQGDMGDQCFWESSRTLLATMTFRVKDTMTICVDTCFWPPTHHLLFIKSDAAVSYVPRDNMPYCFSLSYPALGDVNADGIINIGDVVFLINYLYRGGLPPTPLEVGDTNCDGIVDIGDVVFLINYLFRGGPEPSC